jgi:hypothetical protein
MLHILREEDDEGMPQLIADESEEDDENQEEEEWEEWPENAAQDDEVKQPVDGMPIGRTMPHRTTLPLQGLTCPNNYLATLPLDDAERVPAPRFRYPRIMVEHSNNSERLARLNQDKERSSQSDQ